MADRKLIQLLIDEEQQNFAVEALSLVKFPAIESDFIFLAKENRYLSLATIDEEQRTLIGPALIPDKNIPRFDEETQEEYDVYFSVDTVKRASELFLEQKRTSEHTFEHSSKIDDVHVVESWLVQDPDQDKSKSYGMSVPKGTWMVRVKVDNDEVWESVKNGEVRGFSIEGYFVDQVEQMSSKVKKTSMAQRLYEAVMGVVKGRNFYAEVSLTTGATMVTEADAMELGVQVQALDDEGKPVDMKDGQYETEAGISLRVASGQLVELDGEVLTEEVVEEETTSAETLRSDMLTLYYKKLLEQQSKTAMSQERTLGAESDLDKWWIFMEPYNYDYRGQGFYIYPFQHGSYDKFQTALTDMYATFPPDAEEWENVDADGMFELTTAGYGMTEAAYKFLEEFAEWCDDNGLELFETYKAIGQAISSDVLKIGMSYIEESYQGQWKSLKDYVIDVVSDSGISEQQAERYFSFDRFGRDVQSDLSSMEYDRVIDDGGTEEEAEAAMDKIDQMRNDEVAEMYIYDMLGGLDQLSKNDKEAYLDWDKMTRDFSYEYSFVDGMVFWNH